jgi:hypothetical protein
MNKLIVFSAALVFISAPPVMGQELLSDESPGGVKSLEDRIEHLEKAIDRPVEGDKWYDRIQVSGLLEVEAGYGKNKYKDPAEEDEETSDIDLATAELVVDARIIDHVDGHIMIKYEEDDLFLDEGYITLSGTEAFPGYLIAGRQYLPFGYFDSHFVTDPTTLVLGETNEGAAVVGYRFGEDLVDVSFGVFNGNAQELGEDDIIDNFVTRISVSPFKDLMFGVSYTSNLASSDAFSDVVTNPDELESLVAAWSVYATYQINRFKLIGEYVAAIDDFEAGEIYDAAETQKRKPQAWNIEGGFAITDTVELAARYGGSDDGGDFLPESEYGAVLNWGVFENTNLALEYLHSEFEEDVQDADVVTLQLAVAF